MKNRKVSFWNSLRFRMPAIVLLGIIPPMLGAIFYASYRADLQLREHAEEDIIAHAELLQSTLTSWDEMNVTNLKQLSDLVSMFDTNMGQTKLILKSFVKNNPSLYIAAAVNLDGWTRVTTSGNNSKYYGDRPWFLGAKLGKEITYQTLIGRSLGKPAVCMSRPITNERSEITSVGLLCSELSTLAKQIGKLKFGQTGYAILVDETGNVLAHPNPALISNKLHNLNQYSPVKHILEGREGYFTYVDEKDVKWISYGISLENDWKVILVQQENEFLQNEQQFRYFVYWEALIAVIIVSIFTWLLANYLIRPIGQLTNVATAISNGDLDRQVEVKRRDELGILAASFEQMVSRLKASLIELEERVKQRTSELNTAKEIAEFANQTKDQFLARISHELRSPLNTIINYATVVEENISNLGNNYSQGAYVDLAQNKKGLSIIRQSGMHLLKLIEDILDFSSASVSQIELHPTYTNWQNFLDEIVAMVELDAQKKQLQVRYETLGDLSASVLVDRNRLQQVLINLLNNAVKFTDQGEVTLKVIALNSPEIANQFHQYPQQQFRFEVIDTGRGINSKYLERIFQPFEQISASEQLTDGIGLGLSISKQIVASMGGKLNVKSQLGLGSVFWFDISLPVVEDIVAKIDDHNIGNALSTKSLGFGQIE